MNMRSTPITELLVRWNDGEDAALELLLPVVYEDLRRIARRAMRGQNSGHTFQTTDLIHEAYLKLAEGQRAEWQNRAHFFAVASRAMRHILVDYARSKQSMKRGGEARRVTLEETLVVGPDISGEIVHLNLLLEQFARIDPRKASIVEMKFFGGMTTDEIAEALDLSPKTIKRDWRFARSWLQREMMASGGSVE